MVYFHLNNPKFHDLIFWLGLNFLRGKLSRFEMWWYLKKPHICSQNNENHMCCKKQNENDGVPCTSFTQQLLLITKCPKHYVVATKESIPGWLFGLWKWPNILEFDQHEPILGANSHIKCLWLFGQSTWI